MTEQKHPAMDYPEAERVDYLLVVAAIATADGNITMQEFEYLNKLCDALELSAKSCAKIMAATADPPDNIPEILTRLSESELRFTLMTDMLFMAYADGVTSDEDDTIKRFAGLLKINDEQLAAMHKYVEAVSRAQESDSDTATDDLKKLGIDVAASMAAVGVPGWGSSSIRLCVWT